MAKLKEKFYPNNWSNFLSSSLPPLETSVAFFSSCKGKKVKVTLEQAMMVQRESRVIALLFI